MFGLTPREMALTFGALVLGAIITLLGYFGKRWIEGTSIDAKLARRTKVLELDAKLKERGMTDADLDKLEGDLVGRRKSQHQAEDQVAAEVAQQRILLGGPRPGETQAEMNRLAAADLDTANAMLARALLELEMHGEHTRLKAAQAAWDAYAVAEAEYRSALFLGGTAYPTIYLSELEQLTVSRIAALRAYTDWRKTL